MKKVNMITSIFLLALAIGAYSMAATFPSIPGSTTGPGSFPKILAVIIAILAIILFVQGIKIKEQTNVSEKIKPAATAMLIVFLYLLAIKFVGFFMVTPIVIILFLIYAKTKNWILYVGLPAGVVIFIYYLFEKMLQVPLPEGSLFA